MQLDIEYSTPIKKDAKERTLLIQYRSGRAERVPYKAGTNGKRPKKIQDLIDKLAKMKDYASWKIV